MNQYTERYFLLRRASNPTKSGLRIAERATSWNTAWRLPLFLLTPEMHNRTIVDASFKKIVLSVQPAIQTNSILTLGLTVLAGEMYSILPGALVSVLRGYSELEAAPLVDPDVLPPIGFMFAKSDRPSNAMRATLAPANDPEWLTQAMAHVGLLEPRQ